MAKRKLSAREKKLRAEVKKELQAEGKLPPDKPRLNRKKFVEEAWEEWSHRDMTQMEETFYLGLAFAYMTARVRTGDRASLEAVGVAKALKAALALRELHKKKQADREPVTYGDQFDAIQGILDA